MGGDGDSVNDGDFNDFDGPIFLRYMGDFFLFSFVFESLVLETVTAGFFRSRDCVVEKD